MPAKTDIRQSCNFYRSQSWVAASCWNPLLNSGQLKVAISCRPYHRKDSSRLWWSLRYTRCNLWGNLECVLWWSWLQYGSCHDNPQYSLVLVGTVPDSQIFGIPPTPVMCHCELDLQTVPCRLALRDSCIPSGSLNRQFTYPESPVVVQAFTSVVLEYSEQIPLNGSLKYYGYSGFFMVCSESPSTPSLLGVEGS
mgnify:FL=1